MCLLNCVLRSQSFFPNVNMPCRKILLLRKLRTVSVPLPPRHGKCPTSSHSCSPLPGRIKGHRSYIMNLSELAEIITEEQKGLASKKGITLETCIQPDILFRGDETMLMRLFINLISNSITYGKENGLTRISLSSDGNLITGSVSDNGIGIEKDKLDKRWKGFYQVIPARSSGEREGAGLGLPMVKWITEAHGGTVCAESTPGSGTVFTFTFPQNK